MKKLFLLSILFIMMSTTYSQKKETMVLIETEYGNMKLKLYNETPQHRDNFIKLAKEGFYNGSIFHRVINHFMIQGGGASNPAQNVNYTIPAEFNQKYYHKKGALAAARLGDQVNPQKASSGSQFYIVQGNVVPPKALDMFSQKKNYHYTDEQRQAYASIGGTPHLDGDYTVFGEVVEGMDVIDKIAAVKTAGMDKPVKDVVMKVTVME